MIWLNRIKIQAQKEDGFTLVELIAAMAVFALAATFVLSVLVAGISTAGFSRDRTLAKELARQQLEEMRRLPYHFDALTYPCVPHVRTDLLDVYFPDLSTPQYSTSTFTYTRSIDPVPGFPRYSLKIASKFVDKTLATVAPPAGYNCTGAGTDDPPGDSQLFTAVTVMWGPNKDRSYVLESVLGEAKLGDVIVQGSATAVMTRVDTAFGDFSTIIAEAGLSTSNIYVGTVSTSRQENTAVRARRTNADGTIVEALGASLSLAAPPNSGPTTVSSPGGAMTHPLTGATEVLKFGASAVQDVKAQNPAAGPLSGGRSNLRPDKDDADDSQDVALHATNEVVGTVSRPLDPNKPFFAVVKVAGVRPGRVDTSCTQGSTTVDCTTNGQVGEIRIAPTNLLLPAGTNGYLVAVRLTDLTASTKASKTGSGGAASASFKGTLRYWELDLALSPPIYVLRTVSLDSGNLAGLPDPASVCLRNVSLTNICDLTLSAFIKNWSRLTAGSTSVSSNHRTASAVVDGVVQMTTQPTNDALPNSGFIFKIGSIDVRAVDNR